MGPTGQNTPASPAVGPSGLQRDSELVVTIIRFALIALAALASQLASISSGLAWAMRVSVFAAFLYNSILLILQLAHVRLRGMRPVMLAVDVLLTSVWVYATWRSGPGQVGSPLFAFYFVVVITSALWFGLRGAFLTSGVIAVTYLAMVWQLSERDPFELIQALYWQIIYVFLVALVSGYLVETYRRESAEWARMREILIANQERMRLEQEERRQLIPQALPPLPKLEMAARWRPAFGEGGDFYDILPLDNDRVAVIIADVSGKSYRGAVKLPYFKGAFLATIRAWEQPDPGHVLSNLNRTVYDTLQPDMFISASVALLDLRSGLMRYANAGQDPPILARRAGEAVTLETGGLVLGVDPSEIYPTDEVALQPGDMLCFYTDGIIEARDPDGAFFGYDGLQAVLHEAARAETPAASTLDDIFAVVARFTHGGPRRDDMTVVVVRYLPNGAWEMRNAE